MSTISDVFIGLGDLGLFAARSWLGFSRLNGSCVYDAVHASRGNPVAELELEVNSCIIRSSTEALRVFVPQYGEISLPEKSAFRETLVVSERGPERGMTFSPTGTTLFRGYKRALTETHADGPREAALRFVLSRMVSRSSNVSCQPRCPPEVSPVSIELTDPPFSHADRIDHPVASFAGVGLAGATDRRFVLPTPPSLAIDLS